MSPEHRAALKLLGRRLRALREARGLTQEDVGVGAGFGSKYISEVERGVRDVPLSTLRAIVERALGAALHEAFLDPPGRPSSRKSTAAGDGSALRERVADYGPDRLPHGVEAAARQISALPPEKRRVVLSLVRGLVRLARSGR